MEQNNTDPIDEAQASEKQSNQGFYEWLKFVVFFAAILIITILVIRVIAPFIFTEYVPSIVGLSDESMEERDSDQEGEAEEAMPIVPSEEAEMADTESESNTDAQSESMDESAEEGATDEAEALPTEEATSSKVEASYSVYIVQPGETLTSIAAAHQVTLDEIIAANELINPNLLKAGQEIRIPE